MHWPYKQTKITVFTLKLMPKGRLVDFMGLYFDTINREVSLISPCSKYALRSHWFESQMLQRGKATESQTRTPSSKELRKSLRFYKQT